MTQHAHFVGEAFFGFGAAEGLVDAAVEADADGSPERILDLEHAGLKVRLFPWRIKESHECKKRPI
jgi:hypothetical protein